MNAEEALSALERALQTERDALLGHDVNALLQSTEQKLAAIRQVESLPPSADAPERVRQLAEMNRANGTLLARRQRAVIWTLRQLGRVESGAYNARGHSNNTAIGRPIAIA